MTGPEWALAYAGAVLYFGMLATLAHRLDGMRTWRFMTVLLDVLTGAFFLVLLLVLLLLEG